MRACAHRDSACMYVFVCVCVCVCVYVCVCVRNCVCMIMCTCALCMPVCVCVHAHSKYQRGELYFYLPIQAPQLQQGKVAQSLPRSS